MSEYGSVQINQARIKKCHVKEIVVIAAVVVPFSFLIKLNQNVITNPVEVKTINLSLTVLQNSNLLIK